MLVVLPVAVLLIGALFTLALKKDWIGITALVASFPAMLYVVLVAGEKVFAFSGWQPPFGIVWVLDSYSVFMSLLVMGITALIVIYSIKYIKRRSHRYYALLCLVSMGMIGISLTGDLFNLYVFFEILSIASYGLVAFFSDRHALEGAFKYLIMGSFASSFILIGIALMYGLTGTLNMADISSKILISPVFYAPLGIMIAGFGLKAAIFPFHAWKPDAIEGTPAPIGALFTATSAAIGLYCIMRILFIFNLIQLNWILIALGIITMFVGAFLTFMQKNITRLLAYSSISQTGYIVIAFGLGSVAGITAGTYQIFNNALIEGLLFMSFGAAIHVLGKENLGNLSVKSEFLLVSSLVGILALTGIPLTNGFASKWLIYMATWTVNPLLTVVTLVITGFTFAYSIKLFSSVFLSPDKKAINIPFSMKVPIFILVVLCIAIGIFPQAGMLISETASKALFELPAYIATVLG